MDNKNRREWLRDSATLSALSILGATSGCGRVDQETAAPHNNVASRVDGRFNVLVHGLAAAVIDPAGIRLMLPDVPDHCYGIGSFGAETLLMKGMYPQLTFQVATKATNLMVDPTIDAVIDLQKNIKPDESQARHVIHLPFPNYTEPIARMRVIQASSSPPGNFFNSGINNPSSLPLLYAFSYNLEGSSPSIPELNWTPQNGSPNLHIWCDPAFFGAGSDHFKAGTDAFNRMFGNKTTLTPGTGKFPQTAADHDNIPAQEQLSLAEFRNSKKIKSDDTSDCWLVFLQNPMP
jgi:hypothetical protein